jgi:hypothetical protein
MTQPWRLVSQTRLPAGSCARAFQRANDHAIAEAIGIAGVRRLTERVQCRVVVTFLQLADETAAFATRSSVRTRCQCEELTCYALAAELDWRDCYVIAEKVLGCRLKRAFSQHPVIT